MFANIVDIGFDKVIEISKDLSNYFHELKDNENISEDELLEKTKFEDYKTRVYFKRTIWPEPLFIRLDITNNTLHNLDKEIEPVENFQSLSVKEIMDKIENEELSFCFAQVNCEINDNYLKEDHVITQTGLMHAEEIFAEDWCCYFIN